jgi:hypothetical protein
VNIWFAKGAEIQSEKIFARACGSASEPASGVGHSDAATHRITRCPISLISVKFSYAAEYPSFCSGTANAVGCGRFRSRTTSDFSLALLRTLIVAALCSTECALKHKRRPESGRSG